MCQLYNSDSIYGISIISELTIMLSVIVEVDEFTRKACTVHVVASPDSGERNQIEVIRKLANVSTPRTDPATSAAAPLSQSRKLT